MLQQERHEQILARLNTDGKVKVKELAVDFEVTEDCIRKDLTALEKEGLLKRIHGGAMQVRKNLHAYHVDERMSVRLIQKKIIAKKAVELIEENTVIFLGISTVNLSLSADTKERCYEDLSNDEMWSLPCFIYPDCQIRLLRHFYAPQGAFSCRFSRLLRYD